MTITEEYFLKLSSLVGFRLTPSNFKQKIQILQTNGTFNQKMKNEALVELILAFAKLEEKLNEGTVQSA